MAILQRAADALACAEADLKRLIGEAAEKGEYSSVETLVRWASTLGTMRSEGQVPQQPSSISQASNGQPEPTKDKAPRRKALRKLARNKRGSYPLFTRAGDALVKIAWSKSSGTEYEHKAPRSVVQKLAHALARRSENGSIISMDDVLPLKADDGSQIPDYQAYVSLAWFRQIGAINQKGRQGYTVKKSSELLKQVEVAWADLPSAITS